jgi:glutamate N-acetyltransferase/amino-acid N-acetyltransferase
MAFSSESFVDIDRVAPPKVRGFRFAGIAAGIKSNGKPDLGVIVADEDVAAAGVYTKNRVRAAPVEIAQKRTRKGKLRAVLVNSGNANACTGKPGEKAALAATAALAKRLGVSAELVAPASTGVIGALLPSDKIVDAMPRLLDAVGTDKASDFARAIMTTDQWPKVAARTITIGKETATVLGVAKGAGMIHPDMATTLAFVVTDAGASPALLQKLLREATDATFNAISVDGDTSTNDTILLLASGRAGTVKAGSKDAKKLREALEDVLGALGRSIVHDGEGAEHVVTFEVSGARSDADARKAAKTIATSPLVKTALHGVDANWGRILAAAGRSGAVFDPSVATIHVGDVQIVRGGMPVGKDAEAAAASVMKGLEYTVRVSLGRGPGRARYLTCDMGKSYIAVNANYRS